jgi:hypothetical protein
MTLVFKQKKVWQIIQRTEAKPITPTAPQITVRTLALPATGAGGIRSDWVEHGDLVLTIINNCLDNSVISHVKSKLTSNEAWLELIQIFESMDEVTKMFLKDKLQTLKMKEGEN